MWLALTLCLTAVVLLTRSMLRSVRLMRVMLRHDLLSRAFVRLRQRTQVCSAEQLLLLHLLQQELENQGGSLSDQVSQAFVPSYEFLVRELYRIVSDSNEIGYAVPSARELDLQHTDRRASIAPELHQCHRPSTIHWRSTA